MNPTTVPAQKISDADYYAGGMMKMHQVRSERPINIPAMRARVEDDAEGISYALHAEIGNLAIQATSITKAISRIENAKAAFMDLTSTPAPREAIEAAARHFDKCHDEAGDLIWDTEPSEVR